MSHSDRLNLYRKMNVLNLLAIQVRKNVNCRLMTFARRVLHTVCLQSENIKVSEMHAEDLIEIVS